MKPIMALQVIQNDIILALYDYSYIGCNEKICISPFAHKCIYANEKKFLKNFIFFHVKDFVKNGTFLWVLQTLTLNTK
jgi:hypothetical protein